MSTEFKDRVEQDAEANLIAVSLLYKRTQRLKLFNSIAMAIPYTCLTVPLFANGAISANASFLAGAFASAAAVQLSRWYKSKLSQDFDKIWNQSDPVARDLTLGITLETFDKKIRKSSNVISYDDFDFKNKTQAISLAFTGLTCLVAPPLAPLLFFSNSQIRELGESAMISTATFYNTELLKKITAPKHG